MTSEWTNKKTNAAEILDKAMLIVNHLLKFVSEGKGKPSADQRALFGAAVVFTYGVWENFVEQLAIELVDNVAPTIQPERVPEQIKKTLEKKTAWELSVTPGWRKIWADSVKLQAIGDEDEKFGMNTAKAGQVKNLLSQVGVTDPYREITTDILPEHLDRSKKNATDAINSLVELRGEIVHTGKIPESLRKAHVTEWRNFIKSAATKIDSACRKQCEELFKK